MPKGAIFNCKLELLSWFAFLITKEISLSVETGAKVVRTSRSNRMPEQPQNLPSQAKRRAGNDGECCKDTAYRTWTLVESGLERGSSREAKLSVEEVGGAHFG